jgi:hypothetical protein
MHANKSIKKRLRSMVIETMLSPWKSEILPLDYERGVRSRFSLNLV